MRWSRRTVLKAGLGAGLLGTSASTAKSSTEEIQLRIGGATFEVSLPTEPFDVPPSALLAWISKSARAATSYFEKFPVGQARIRIRWDEGRRGVLRGRSFGENGALCEVTIGEHVTEADLKSDWVMTHEMVHLGFPSVSENHRWIEEGSATYIEPIARAQIGDLTAKRVWGDMVRDMPQGLAQPGDRGLDNTHTWGRTYWGGALFCLLADVDIRKNTSNEKGLEDAFRAINRAGGNITVEWPLARSLAIGSKATDSKTLPNLYKQMALKPGSVDLPALWRQLGVLQSPGGVVFDNKAPLARIRDAIVPYTET